MIGAGFRTVTIMLRQQGTLSHAYVDSLEALNAFDRAAASAPQVDQHIAQRSELLEEAAERVYFVVIQREAMKLSYYEKFFEDYGVPEEVKARLGPKRRNAKALDDLK